MSCVMPDAKDGRPHFMHGMERLPHVSGDPVHLAVTRVKHS
jgi:hypothetical protein